MSIIYPHRILFINRGKCSVCGESSRTIVNTNLDHYFGWESCNNNSCNDTIKNSYKKTTIKKDSLIDKYGSHIKIIRSNNQIDDGWEIDSDARKEQEGGEYWVYVINPKKNKRKEVTLKSVELANSINHLS